LWARAVALADIYYLAQAVRVSPTGEPPNGDIVASLCYVPVKHTCLRASSKEANILKIVVLADVFKQIAEGKVSLDFIVRNISEGYHSFRFGYGYTARPPPSYLLTAYRTPPATAVEISEFTSYLV